MPMVRLFHLQLFYDVKSSIKIAIFSVASIIAYLTLAFAIIKYDEDYGFTFIVIASMTHGAARAFGESVIIGFFKFFPSRAMNYYASGTGFSEIAI